MKASSRVTEGSHHHIETDVLTGKFDFVLTHYINTNSSRYKCNEGNLVPAAVSKTVCVRQSLRKKSSYVFYIVIVIIWPIESASGEWLKLLLFICCYMTVAATYLSLFRCFCSHRWAAIQPCFSAPPPGARKDGWDLGNTACTVAKV